MALQQGQKPTLNQILHERWTLLYPVLGALVIILFYQLYAYYIVLPGNLTFSAYAASGWYPPANEREKKYRWTNGDATLRFANLGYPFGDDTYELSLNISRGFDVNGTPVSPLTVTVSMGGQILGYIDTGKPFSGNEIVIPSALLRANGPDPVVRITDDATTLPGDERRLGVRLGSAILNGRPFSLTTIPPPFVLIGMIILYTLGSITARRINKWWGTGFFLTVCNSVYIFGVGIMRPVFEWLIIAGLLIIVLAMAILWRRELAAWLSNRNRQPSAT